MDFKMNIFHSNPPHKNDIKPQAQSISILFTNSSAPSIKKLILQYYNNSKELQLNSSSLLNTSNQKASWILKIMNTVQTIPKLNLHRI